MKNVIILHGMPTREEYYDPAMPSMSNAHWFPWLQSQLLKNDIPAVTPEIPRSFEPHYTEWEREVERFETGPETTLVGHSLGGGFWVKYLSLHPDLTVGKVVLVAPWLDPDGDETSGFFADYTIDTSLVSRTEGLIIYNSANDMGNVYKSVAALRQKINNVDYREMANHGHFTLDSMGTTTFPELLDELLNASV